VVEVTEVATRLVVTARVVAGRETAVAITVTALLDVGGQAAGRQQQRRQA